MSVSGTMRWASARILSIVSITTVRAMRPFRSRVVRVRRTNVTDESVQSSLKTSRRDRG